MKKLAIISTHPVQYNAPLFKLLSGSDQLNVRVFYTWSQAQSEAKFDPGFGKVINWDIPLLEGYDYCFVENVSSRPGSDHSMGIVNPTLNKEVEEWEPHAILVYGWNFESHLRLLRYFKGKVPVFFRGDSTLLDETIGFRRLLRRRFLRGVYKNIDYAFYVGTNNYKYYQALGLREDQLLFAPHSVNDTRFTDPNNEYRNAAADMRQSMNIADDEVVFLFAGKLEPKKDPQLLLQAFMKLRNNRDHLLLVGNGMLESNLRSMAEGNRNVHFMDFCNQSQMPVIYRVGDVLVLPSKGPAETWGLCINEAMICERAIIASDKVGCAIDLVKSSVNGFVFQSGNKEDLSSKLGFFSGNRGLCEGYGKQSATLIQSWSLQQTAASMIRGILQNI